MNDPKAAAAYHPGDGRVTRADLDVLIANLREDPRDLGLILQETMVAAADALEAELARADQAKQRIAAAPHAANCSLVYSVWKSSATRCTCWKSAAPTAEQ